MEIRTLKDNTEIKFSEGNHSYYVTKPNGEKDRPKSVTGLLKVAMESFGIGAMAGRKNLRETLIESARFISENDKYPIHFEHLSDFVSWLQDLNKVAVQKWQDGADRGTLVHNYIQDIALGKKPKLDKDKHIAKLQKAVKKWYRLKVKTALTVEKIVYNRAFNYAGKYDLEADIKGYGRCLVDYKTGSSLNNSEKYPIQLLAYMECILEEDNSKPFGRLIVHINRDTAEITERFYDVSNYERDKSIWYAIVSLASYVDAYKKEWT
jgi:hypothetical protein